MRAIGSAPTIYVDGVKSAKAYHQDNARGCLEIEFLDGSHTSFASHLFSAAEIHALAAPTLKIDDLSGLDRRDRLDENRLTKHSGDAACPLQGFPDALD